MPDETLRSSLIRLFRFHLAIGLLLVIGAVATGVSLRRSGQLKGVPDIAEPFAGKSEYFRRIDSAVNARHDYELAEQQLPPETHVERRLIHQAKNAPWEDINNDIRMLLPDVLPALQHWKEGTEKANHQDTPIAEQTYETLLSAGLTRRLVGLSSLQCLYLERESHATAAWSWHRALFRYSRHLQMNGSTIERVLGTYAHARAADGIVRWAHEGQLDTSDLLSALHELRHDYRMTIPLSDTVAADYFMDLEQLNQWKTHRDEYRTRGMEDELLRQYLLSDSQVWLAGEPELTRRLLKHQAKNLAAFVDLPRAERPPLIESEVRYFDAVVPGDSEVLSPDLFKVALARSEFAQLMLNRDSDIPPYREQARQAMLELALSLECYRRQEGQFPETLVRLTESGIVESLPIDPFSREQELISYARDSHSPHKARVWSVGPNGVNDGGALEHVPSAGTLDVGIELGRMASGRSSTQ